MAKNAPSSVRIPSWKSYAVWIANLRKRWRATQVKAAVAVNSALIEFYWDLGCDIAERYPDSRLGNEFYRQMSLDLKDGNPDATGLSLQTLKYCGYFYRLYAIPAAGQQVVDSGKLQQPVAKIGRRNRQQLVDDANSGYQIKRLLPTPAQLAKCHADAEAQLAAARPKTL